MATRKHLLNVGAILRGLSITFGFMFRRRPTIQYPSVKKQHAPRFHGLHELRRYADGKERCIGCELCSSVCPANAITVIGAENSADILQQSVAESQKRINDLETQLTQKKKNYIGRLPDQIGANVQMVNGARQQFESLSIQIRARSDTMP